MGSQDVHVMHWNAQGITTESAASQLEKVLHERNIDILLLNETFLKPHHKFKLGGYKIHREDRQTHGGGVLIAIKNHIHHKLLPKVKTKSIENISVEVIISGRSVRFISAYNPVYTSNFKSDLDILTNYTNDYFLFGDLNAQHVSWNCAADNSAGKELYTHHLSSNYYIFHPDTFTRFGQNIIPVQTSTVDILLSNSNLSFSRLEAHPNILQSDHIPITCHIFGQPQNNLLSVPLYNRANWPAIKNWVENEIKCHNIGQIENNSNNLDFSLNKLISIIKEAHDMIPVGQKNPWQREISNTSKMLISQRNKFNRKLQRCRDTNYRTHLICILKQLNRLIDFHLNRDRNESWSNFISKLPSGSKKFWKLTKAVKGKNSTVSELNINGNVLRTGEEKANAIADVFSSNHTITTNNSSPLDNVVLNYVQDLNNVVLADSDNIELTNPSEVKSFIFFLKNNKSPGLDGINSIILKHMPEYFFETLSKLFNYCLKNGHFPLVFKKAKVIPVFKTGKDPKLPSSYRPISILSLLDKVFEKIIHKRIVEFAEQNDVINQRQFGFRKEHSTVHQIKRVVNIIEKNKRNRRSTGVIFLDIEKAFDTIWHNGLLFKLNSYSFPIYLQKIIQSFLMSRSFVVFVDNNSSSEKDIHAGLPQGSVLSPTLYSLYTTDITLRKNQEAAFYADDSAFICSGKVSNGIVKRMQESLNSSQKYFNKWKIKVNDNKTQAIIFPFNKSPKRIPSQIMYCRGNIIPIKSEIKYLGIILDKKLKFKQHVDHICQKAIRCGRALYPILSRRSKLNLKNKTLLYKMCIRPIMTYGCQVWFQKTAKTHTKKLQIIQNKNLKIIHGLSHRYPTDLLHSNFEHKMLNSFVSELTLSFNDKCRMSNFETIRNLQGDRYDSFVRMN